MKEIPSKIPDHLSHKPIIIVENYSNIDGEYAKDTDVVGLSIGIPHYDAESISAKIWRYKSESQRWSRQSEELPLHRVLDLCILTLAALQIDPESDLPSTILGERIFEGKNADVKTIKIHYENNKNKLKPRLDEIKRLVSNFLEKP
jgi:hypothetical protein